MDRAIEFGDFPTLFRSIPRLRQANSHSFQDNYAIFRRAKTPTEKVWENPRELTEKVWEILLIISKIHIKLLQKAIFPHFFG